MEKLHANNGSSSIQNYVHGAYSCHKAEICAGCIYNVWRNTANNTVLSYRFTLREKLRFPVKMEYSRNV